MTPGADLICRRESQPDILAIRTVETAAFRRPVEAALVDNLRDACALPLSAVAEIAGRVVGHIAYSPVTIESERGSFNVLGLAPLAVHPDWQRQGIGSALIRWSLSECAFDGHALVIVIGHPEYYPRFGFVPAMPLGIRCPFEVPTEAFMLLELQPGALAGRTGTVCYRPEFDRV